MNRESFVTDRAGVFAGGDVVRGPSTVIDAIADGKRVATMIDHYLTGKQLRTFPKVRLPTVYIEPVADETDSDEPQHRATVPLLTPEARRHNLDEVELAMSESQAVCEARRCLRCDLDFTRPQ